ncbi:unnamed protein product [Ilex paraguariensis]|uniref:BSD domain-containing protein n=1 Tax=Ilex paraguariensis TaxID=185542 RepID=A0ABC8S1B0_9AQUA
MNFFKSILSDDPDPLESENPQESEPNSPANLSDKHDGEDDVVGPDRSSESHDQPNSNPNSSAGYGGWSFGGLIQTFATRSESMLETYRRDLKEFGSGLKKETSLFREVANRAVKDLPASIEVGASVAHGAIDGVLKSTAEIIAHGKETLLAPSDIESDTPDTNLNLSSRRYSRFDTQLRAIQSDVKTYSEEPEDLEDYNKWKLGFVLEEKNEEVENLVAESGALEGIYTRVVPNEVDRETFWSRYFYRVHKLDQQESVRANLVKRAISIDDEEELTWDVDDEDDDAQENNGSPKGDKFEDKEFGNKDLPQILKEESDGSSKGYKLENKELGGKDLTQIVKEEAYKESQSGSSRVDDGKEDNMLSVGSVNSKAGRSNVDNVADKKELSIQTLKVRSDEVVSKSDDKVVLDGKADSGESCKDSDVSFVSSQQSIPDEQDLEWDEIDDVGSSDEKVTHDGSPNRAEVRKRLSAAEEDEDLSWDIEDDDEPVKA